LTVREDDGTTATIERAEPNVGTQMLGIRINPACTEDDEFNYQKKSV